MATHYLQEGKFTLADLLSQGILSERSVRDIEFSLALGPNRRYLPLHYVGLLETAQHRVFVLPKYCTPTQREHAHTIVKVLRLFAKQGNAFGVFPDVYLFSDQHPDGLTSKVDLASWLLEDFYAHGLLSIHRQSFGVSSRHWADWLRTVMTLEPVWTASGPVYDRWVSRKRQTADRHWLTAVHRTVIAACHARYGALLGLPDPDLGPARQVASLEQAITLINGLLRQTYAVRHIEVMQALLLWLRTDAWPERPVTYFGTRHFHVVWEQCCAFLLHDVKSQVPWRHAMPQPEWHQYDDGQTYLAKGRFVPDILTMLPDDTGLLVSDAKYYLPVFERGVAHGVPGVESLSKQVHYETLLRQTDALQTRPVAKLKNAFLFPGSRVSPFMAWTGTVQVRNIMTRPIECLTLNPWMAMERYLRRQALTNAELRYLASDLPPEGAG